MDTVNLFSENTGLEFDDGTTCEPFRLLRGKSARVVITTSVLGTKGTPTTALKKNAQTSKHGKNSTERPPTTVSTQDGESMSFAVATPAKQTQKPTPRTVVFARRSEVSSSALLMYFARELWSERIHQAGTMLLGLGSDSERNLSVLATLACPLDSGAAALGLTAKGSECLCSPHWSAPKASDWKGGTSKHRTDGGNRNEFKHQWTRETGYTYPDPEVMEDVLTFPVGWTALEQSETPFAHAFQNGLGDESQKV